MSKRVESWAHHPANLEEAEVMFYLDRNLKPKRRTQREIRDPKTSGQRFHCLECGKWGYLSEQTAREVIGVMLRQGVLRGPDTFCFKPYLCAHGFWHVGHDLNTRTLMEVSLGLPVSGRRRIHQPSRSLMLHYRTAHRKEEKDVANG